MIETFAWYTSNPAAEIFCHKTIPYVTMNDIFPNSELDFCLDTFEVMFPNFPNIFLKT